MRLRGTQLGHWRIAKSHLLLPIVYVRGSALTGGEIEETTADPFNGFNIGSTLLRTSRRPVGLGVAPVVSLMMVTCWGYEAG